MQAAIGRYQLNKLDKWIEKRKINGNFLREVCNKFPNLLRTPIPPAFTNHAYYKFYTYLKVEGLKQSWDRNRIIKEISVKGIPCFEGSCSEIYEESAFDDTTFKPKQRLAIAKELGESSIVFLVHPTLSKKDIKDACKVMENVFLKATK